MIVCKSEPETITAAQTFAQTVQSGDIILLNGTLGAGKTVFARALIRALCENESLEVLSPTFTLLQTYESDIGDIHHYDLYRLEDPEDILQIGWEDSLSGATVIVEWPKRLGTYKPQNAIEITITIDAASSDRHIEINEQ